MRKTERNRLLSLLREAAARLRSSLQLRAAVAAAAALATAHERLQLHSLQLSKLRSHTTILRACPYVLYVSCVATTVQMYFVFQIHLKLTRRICILSKLFKNGNVFEMYFRYCDEAQTYTVEVKVKASVWGRICKAVEAAKVH